MQADDEVGLHFQSRIYDLPLSIPVAEKPLAMAPMNWMILQFILRINGFLMDRFFFFKYPKANIRHIYFFLTTFIGGDVSCIYQIIKRKSYNEVYQTNSNNAIVLQLSRAIE